MPRKIVEAIDEEDIRVIFGCCCCNTGLYCTKCLGVSTETTCLCLDHMCCLKCGAEPLWCAMGNSEECIRLGLGCCSIGLIHPTTCCKGQAQICCIVESYAFPPDAEIPATLACFGLVCMPRCGICTRLNAVKHYQKPGAPPAAESTIEAPAIQMIQPGSGRD